VTPTWILAIGMLLVLALLGVVSWHLIRTLHQAQRAAAALEEFLGGTRPQIEQTIEQLRSVLGRADRILSALESGAAEPAQLAGSVGRLVNTVTTVLHTVSAFSALAKGVLGALRSFQSPRDRSGVSRRK